MKDYTHTKIEAQRESRNVWDIRNIIFHSTSCHFSRQRMEKEQASTSEKEKKIVLDYDNETWKDLVSVHSGLAIHLKPHQIDGIKFMWDACFGSVKEMEGAVGGGCILAHCMGLGKTLQIITLIHTLFAHKLVNSVLICCPVNTILNWRAEFQKWLDGKTIKIYDLTKSKQVGARAHHLDTWTRNGGVMIIGYEMFRIMITKKGVEEKTRNKIFEALIHPGPDLVVCDEGHVLKNMKTALSQTISRIRTPRRIVLTGTPLQNNLSEYYCMVNFVKPDLLGTKSDFQSNFSEPISSGQFYDSTEKEVVLMKEKSHILHQILERVVQRRDYTVLQKYLPPKQEFVILVRMSDLQAQLYRHYIDKVSLLATTEYCHMKEVINKKLLMDYQKMRLIWTHPLAMKLNDERRRKIKNKDEFDVSDHQNFSDSSDSDILNEFPKNKLKRKKSQGKKTPPVKKVSTIDSDSSTSTDSSEFDFLTTDYGISFMIDNSEDKPESDNPKEVISKEDKPEWWTEFVLPKDLEDPDQGPKLSILFSIINECELEGDKILIFSQSIASLDMIEYFLQCSNGDKQWEKNFDYFRLDGTTPKEKRAEYCNSFNNPKDEKSRLFLISTKAGGMGINLTAANRVVIFDACWNPSHDVQSLFRVYRFGQTKPCYIYRLVSQGTMEEKIYERQVTKLSVARRVIDEEQIIRHFTRERIGDLYAFNRAESMICDLEKLPKNDSLIAKILKRHSSSITNYHEHDSFLEPNLDEDLSPEQREAAEERERSRCTQETEERRIEDEKIMKERIFLQLKKVNPSISEDFESIYRNLLEYYSKAMNKIKSKNDKPVRRRTAKSKEKKSGTSSRPRFSMRPHMDLERNNPEIAEMKRLALLHLLQSGRPISIRNRNTPCSWALRWFNKERRPEELLQVLRVFRCQHTLDIVGANVLVHFNFRVTRNFLKKKLWLFGIFMTPVKPDLESIEVLMQGPDTTENQCRASTSNHRNHPAPTKINNSTNNESTSDDIIVLSDDERKTIELESDDDRATIVLSSDDEVIRDETSQEKSHRDVSDDDSFVRLEGVMDTNVLLSDDDIPMIPEASQKTNHHDISDEDSFIRLEGMVDTNAPLSEDETISEASQERNHRDVFDEDSFIRLEGMMDTNTPLSEDETISDASQERNISDDDSFVRLEGMMDGDNQNFENWEYANDDPYLTCDSREKNSVDFCSSTKDVDEDKLKISRISNIHQFKFFNINVDHPYCLPCP